MTKYKFYDSDIWGNEEYDISGDEYVKLIDFCCDNSLFLSLKHFTTRTQIFKELESYKLENSLVERIKMMNSINT